MLFFFDKNQNCEKGFIFFEGNLNEKKFLIMNVAYRNLLIYVLLLCKKLFYLKIKGSWLYYVVLDRNFLFLNFIKYEIEIFFLKMKLQNFIKNIYILEIIVVRIYLIEIYFYECFLV